MLVSTVAFGQTYFVVNWDDYTANSNVAYCTCDYIKCVPPEGVTGIYWGYPGNTEYVDTLLLENGFDGKVTCFYDGGDKYLRLRPTFSPISPLFPTDIDTCVLAIDLDAGNYSQYGFTTYDWSNGANSQTISVGPGTYSVDIHNVCGDISASTTVHYDNPNAPDLGPDQEVCVGEQVILTTMVSDPVSTTWYPGGSTSTDLEVTTSGTYRCYVVDANGCSGRDTVVITFIPTIDMEMCHVSFDTLTNKNQITWFVDPMQEAITDVKVYVKNNLGQWVLLGTEDYQNGYFIHWESNPTADYNEYRIAAVSECGDGEMSDIHRSIWLSTFQSELQWQNYYGTFVPDYYTVFAKMNTGELQQLGTVGSCSGGGCLNHYVISQNPDIVKYFVAFEHDCSSNKDGENWVFSNNVDAEVGINTAESTSFSIYPNPANESVIIHSEYSDYEVSIYTITGQQIMQERNCNTIDISDVAAGTYIVLFKSGDTVSRRKLVVE